MGSLLVIWSDRECVLVLLIWHIYNSIVIWYVYCSISCSLHMSPTPNRELSAPTWDQKSRLRWFLWLYRSSTCRKSWTPGYLGPIESSDFVGLPGFGFAVVYFFGWRRTWAIFNLYYLHVSRSTYLEIHNQFWGTHMMLMNPNTPMWSVSKVGQSLWAPISRRKSPNDASQITRVSSTLATLVNSSVFHTPKPWFWSILSVRSRYSAWTSVITSAV